MAAQPEIVSADQVDDLRTKSGTDRGAARDTAWRWIEGLKELAKSDAGKADEQLNELFRLGRPALDLDGPTDGILVMTTTNPVLDTVAKAVTTLWMPWQGKRFDSASGSGDNRMTSSSAVITKLIWPLYSMKAAKDGKLAFDFTTYVDAGKDDPDRQVLVIDYADIEGNPKLVIRSIRDELVELVPGAFLGKILYRTGKDKYAKIGYFALRTDQ